MDKILAINAAQRLDSRGNPTVQVTLETQKGTFKSIVPSGASKGDYEAVELRDGEPTQYHGNGVEKAVNNVQDVLGPAIIAKDFNVGRDYAAIDDFMIGLDGSSDKGNLGANAILAISMACWRAAAAAKGLQLYELIHKNVGTHDATFTLPVPFFNVLNGGVHSGNTMPFQEFMVAPVGAGSMAEAVRMGSEVYQELKSVIKTKFGAAAIGIGDEGGFAPPISHPHEALDLLVEAVSNCGYSDRVKFAIDPASSEFFNKQTETYDLGFKLESANQELKYSQDRLAALYKELLINYPIILLEDPFAQDDWKAWTGFNRDCSVELVGDDLLATNKKRIEMAKEKRACNSLLLKINQIGTINEAIAAASQAYSYGWSVFVSHRSGETTDDFIADLTVGLGTGHLKSGSPCRGERIVKYNRLMDIEDEIKANNGLCIFAGQHFKGRAA